MKRYDFPGLDDKYDIDLCVDDLGDWVSFYDHLTELATERARYAGLMVQYMALKAELHEFHESHKAWNTFVIPLTETDKAEGWLFHEDQQPEIKGG